MKKKFNFIMILVYNNFPLIKTFKFSFRIFMKFCMFAIYIVIVIIFRFRKLLRFELSLSYKFFLHRYSSPNIILHLLKDIKHNNILTNN